MTTDEMLAIHAMQHGMTLEQYKTWQDQRAWSYLSAVPELTFPSLPPKRRHNQPKHKIAYETRDDLWDRLGNTFIWIGPNLYCLDDIREYKGEFWLIVNSGSGQHFRIAYSSKDIDLRSPEPQYLNVADTASFVTRRAERQFQQGNSRSNIFYKKVGKSNFHRFENLWELIPAFKNAENLIWVPAYQNLVKQRAVSALRLSPCVAIYRDHKSERIVAEYRGRPLGYVEDNCVLLDEHDYGKPWSRNDLHEVGCTTKVGTDAPQASITDE
jgi:hypothetical protein